MYNVHIEVESLVYIYVYVGSRTIFSPVIPTFTLLSASLLMTLPCTLKLMIPNAQRTLLMLILLKFNPGLTPG